MAVIDGAAADFTRAEALQKRLDLFTHPQLNAGRGACHAFKPRVHREQIISDQWVAFGTEKSGDRRLALATKAHKSQSRPVHLDGAGVEHETACRGQQIGHETAGDEDSHQVTGLRIPVVGDPPARAVDLEVGQTIEAADHFLAALGERVLRTAIDDPFGDDFIGRPPIGDGSVLPSDDNDVGRSLHHSGRQGKGRADPEASAVIDLAEMTR